MLRAMQHLQSVHGQDLVKLRITGDFQESMTDAGHTYHTVLAASRLCIAPRGTSHETLRIYEGLRLGCVVISDYLPSHPFYQDSPIIQIEDWAELPSLVDELLQDPDRMRALHERGCRYWEDILSEHALARYYADALGIGPRHRSDAMPRAPARRVSDYSDHQSFPRRWQASRSPARPRSRKPSAVGRMKPSETGNVSPWANRSILLLFFGSLVVSSVGGGSVVRLGFPLAVTGLAALLAIRNPAGYVRLLLWSIFTTPGLRHYLEWHSGFSQSDPIMLSSYLIVLAATPSVFHYLLNGRRYTVEFLTLIVLIAMGTGIALLTGDVMAPLLDAARWVVAPMIGIYVCANLDALPGIRRSVVGTFLLGLPVMAIYGIVQFVDIQPWDAYFMKMAPIDSIGFPVPFAVRVFGLSNSPGTLASTLATGILLLIPGAARLRWFILLASAAALLLTTQRAVMGAFVVAITLLVALTRDPRLRRNVAKAIVGVSLVVLLLLVVPGAATKIEGVGNSFTNLSQDGSAQARWDQYLQVFAILDADMLGRGLDWQNNGAYVLVGSSVPLDSGLIDIFVSFGIFGGTAFLLMLLVLLAKAWCATRRAGADAAAELAGAVLGVAQLPMGGQQAGETGILIFLCLGMLLARSSTRIGQTWYTVKTRTARLLSAHQSPNTSAQRL